MSSTRSSPWVQRATADGSWTLWNEPLGEGCHSNAGAWTQARERYARACELHVHRGPVLRLLDVGTGLGLNLAAALEALAQSPSKSGVGLDACTFEADAEVIERGLELYERAELLGGPWEPWHRPVRQALRAALAAPGTRIEWEAPSGEGGRDVRHGLVLHLGDARTTLAAVPREPAWGAIFLDPFSPRRSPSLWEEPFLAELAARLAPAGWLSTYSASFRVRLALARAGLRVGRGPRVGAKGEGTLASPTLAAPELMPRVARRLARRTTGSTPWTGLILPFRLREPSPRVD